MELLRGVRSQLTELLSGLDDNDLAPMSLELSHILARYKLKITSDKVVIKFLCVLFYPCLCYFFPLILKMSLLGGDHDIPIYRSA